MKFFLNLSIVILLFTGVYSQTGLLPEELYSLIQNKEDILILDIRSDNEYSDDNKVPEAIHIPFDLLATELKARGLDYSKQIVIYDRTGNVGRIAVSFLNKMLYTNARYLIGGHLAWNDNLVRIEKNIPENVEVPFATRSDFVLDSLNHEIPANDIIQADTLIVEEED